MARPHEKQATFGWLSRMLRYRLVIPIHRNRQDPRPAARGVAVGLLFALTPTVGVQLPLLGLFWALMRWLRPTWRFNLLVAGAWVWVTNILTIPIVYYVFLVTGRVMMGIDHPFGGFDDFRAHMLSLLTADVSFFQSLYLTTLEIFHEYGEPLFLGCIPWAIGGAWLGYRWSLTVLEKLHARHRRKIEERFARQLREAGGPSGSASPPSSA